MQLLMPVPRIAWPARGAVLAGLVFAAWLLGGWGGADTTQVVSDVGFLVFGGFALGCAGWAARVGRGDQRWASICLMIGLAGWVFGDAIWAYYRLGRHQDLPFPSPADAGYLLLPVGVCLALVLSSVGRTGQPRFRLVLDGLLVAGSLFLVSWVLVLRGLFDTGGASHFAFAVTLAYPLSDLVVGTVGVIVLTRARTGQRPAVALLLAGVVLMAVSNDVFCHLTAIDEYVVGGRTDIGWVASLLAFAFAALASRRISPHPDLGAGPVPSRGSSWLPYVPLALSGVVATGYLLHHESAVVLAVGVLLVTTVLVRQFLVVGENRRLLVRVSEQALRDPLTGLANRVLFHDRLSRAVGVQRRDWRRLAVLSLDLDDFKLVNDSLGHPAGDALLIQVAGRLLRCVRAGDTVARLGGDEFAVLLEGGIEDGLEVPRVVAQRVVESFDAPFVVDGQDVVMRPSVGLAVAPTEAAPELCADLLLKEADVAMYAAKRARSSGVHVFAPDMHLVDLNERDLPQEPNGAPWRARSVAMRLLSELRRAIEHGDLSLVYQPKYALPRRDVVGVEALVRWPHPERGLLGPEHFLPLVRQNGLMHALTELVIEQALGDAARWRAEGFEVPVAVNMFAPTLADLDLPSRISRALHNRALSGEVLTVEITEDLVVGSLCQTRTVLNQLRECGIRVAIDDFGSAYSALYYLRELPVDEVKLDQLFIAPILDDPRAAAIVRAIIDLAHTLGVATVAEGVENAQTATRLEAYGCDAAQGFHFSAPLPCPALVDLFSASTRTMATPIPSGIGSGSRSATMLDSPRRP